MAVPFFILAGEIMNAGGLSKRIVNVALTLVGHVRGGLGYVVILASCILAALSGSAVADAAALSALLFPMMVKAGHDPHEARGPDRRRRDHRADHSAVDRLHRVRRRGGPVDLEAVPRRHLPGLLLGVGLAVAWWLEARKENVAPPPRASCEGSRSRADRRRLGAGAARDHHLRPEVRRVHADRGGGGGAVYALFVAMFVYRELQWRDLYDVFAAPPRRPRS